MYVLGSKSLPYLGLKIGYSFKRHYYFIARCTLTLVAKTLEPMLSHIT